MKSITLNLIGVSISGTVTLNLWGGGQGEIEMYRSFLATDKATKDNILRCVNDGGFGCESIASANIEISYCYTGGMLEYNRTVFTDSIHHSSLFLGWRELNNQGIDPTGHQEGNSKYQFKINH